MAHRGNEMGMDYEYSNRTGAIDARSPFAQLSQNAQRFPPTQTPNKKRPYSQFDFPPKPSAGQHSSPGKPLPPNPPMGHLFSTPRMTHSDYDDSSAGETPRSPEQHIDSDATPENMGLRSARNRFEAANPAAQTGAERERGSPTRERERPTASRRDSWIVKAWKKYSPGRGEVPRGGDHVKGKETRVKKRRSQERERELHKSAVRRRRHSLSDSGEDEDDSELPTRSPRKISGQQASHHDAPKVSWLSGMFTFIAQHPTVPHILSFYAQLAFNIFLLAGCAWLLFCFWGAVQSDINNRAFQKMAEIMAEMAVCAQEYTKNKCERGTRAPALETVCEQWSKCMNQNPEHVGRARVSAFTFAEIFNSFVEPISWKAMIFTFLLVFGCFATTNLAFGFFRDKAAHAVPQYQHFYPPPTQQQRSFSGQDGGYYGTPWHQPPQMGLEPAPSGGFAQIDGRGSPVRRLQYG